MNVKSAAALCAAALSAAVLFGDVPGYRLYNIVPCYEGHEAEQAAKSVELYERTGVDLALYSLTLHPEGKPAMAKVDRLLASYARYAKALEGTKVRPGILVQAILGHWPRTDKDVEPWMRTVDQDGKVVRFCPLDPGFGAYITTVFEKIARLHPAFVLTDDDVRAYSHGAECFCARHVALFNARRGTQYDSDGLRKAVAASKPGQPDYDVFFALQREMMENDVVGRIRKAMDGVDPALQSGVCVAGEEHYFAVPLARRIAAKGQTPVLRCSTGCYNERMTAARFPAVYLRMLGFAEAYRPEGVSFLDEADTCPQNLWSKSSVAFYTHLVASCFAGMDGAKTWYVNGLRKSGIPVTRAYTDVLADHRGQLDALAAVRGDAKFVGLAAPCFLKTHRWHAIANHDEFFTVGNVLTKLAAPNGIPIAASAAFGDPDVVFLLGEAEEVRRLSDADLDALFSGRVLVLVHAACELTRRGKAALIGCAAKPDAAMIYNGEWDRARNRRMNFSSAMDGAPVRFTPQPGAETLTDLYFNPSRGAEREIVAPASTWFRNARGGEVICSTYRTDVMVLTLFSAERQQWLQGCVERLAAVKPTFCGNEQDMLMSERRFADGSRLVLAVNLNPDPVKRLALRVDAGAAVSRLGADGKWTPVPAAEGPDAASRTGFRAFACPLAFYESTVLRVSPAM